MKLTDLTELITSDFMVGVNKRQKFIEEFSHTDAEKRIKYRYATVTSIHVLNENTIAINVDIDN